MQPIDPPLRAFLDLTRDRFASALGRRLRGAYVCGSLPQGAFDERRSDIDLVACAGEALDELTAGRLAAALRDLADTDPLGGRLSGFVAWETDGRWESLPFHRAQLCARRSGPLRAVCRRELRRHGLTLAGPDPLGVFPPATRRQLDEEMRCNLFDYWTRIARREWPRFLFDEGVDFAVLTLPRILYTLETGELITKPGAAAWLERRFPEWADLVSDVRGRFFPAYATPPLSARLGRARQTRRFVLDMIAASHELRRR